MIDYPLEAGVSRADARRHAIRILPRRGGGVAWSSFLVDPLLSYSDFTFDSA